ncbi:hypothetical protein HZB69_02575 [Candidatus Amesbacteria bacterium]|nr:hypothetical protein [Candidatus Amesbacteria bacterium]
MKKEVLLAIGVGFGLGLVITFGIWTANKSLKRANTTKTMTSVPTPSPLVVSATPVPSPIPSTTLMITAPEDESLVATNTINITGKAQPKSIISVAFEEGEMLAEADANGNFTIGVDLIGGYNTLFVTAIDPVTGVESTKTLIVTYSTAKI